ncbi:hypothetical protein [Deinococcus hopiensis]|uniref:hypothetical protein n=1 Tax=Deinococcus hopiensis TaxID=309885 RepID=UPI00111C3F53|nr:hypothetical protein [Deinococcus hopiensis]
MTWLSPHGCEPDDGPPGQQDGPYAGRWSRGLATSGRVMLEPGFTQIYLYVQAAPRTNRYRTCRNSSSSP